MNRRKLIFGGLATIGALLTNVRGSQPVQAEVLKEFYELEHFIDYDADGRIVCIADGLRNRWLYMTVENFSGYPEYNNACTYEIYYGSCEPVERLRTSQMPFGLPGHETVSEYNERVIRFFNWVFAQFEYEERESLKALDTR